MPPPRFGCPGVPQDQRRFRANPRRLRGGRTAHVARAPRYDRATWLSSGWTHERNVRRCSRGSWRGEVAVSARRGRERLWDLPERVFPAGVTALPTEEASRQRDERWLRARDRRPKFVGEAGIPVDGRRHAEGLAAGPGGDRGGFEGRRPPVAIRRLSHDRARARPVRVRVHARDVQAEGERAGAIALQISTGMPWWQDRRDRGPRGGRAAGGRDPRGLTVHAEGAKGRRG